MCIENSIISWFEKTVESSGSLVSLSLSVSENETTWGKKVPDCSIKLNFQKEQIFWMFQRHKKARPQTQQVYRVF